MKDQGFEHAHSSPIKTPRQLITVIVLAFAIPVFGIVLLAHFVVTGQKPDASLFEPDVVARRIQPVARVEFADAAAGPRAALSGEEVYKAVCAACHGAGVAGAWKFGDKEAWAPHLKGGLDALVKNAINGIRAMPPRGGRADLTDIEVARAVVYMANAAGANFKEPPAPAAASAPAAAAPAPAATPAAAPAPAPPAAQQVAATPAATPAPAAHAGPLLQKYGCVACHAADKKMVGPSYQEIAAKYGADALPKLVQKVKAGGAGNWGPVPMPPHPQVSDADLQAMVQYILAKK